MRSFLFTLWRLERDWGPTSLSCKVTPASGHIPDCSTTQVNFKNDSTSVLLSWEVYTAGRGGGTVPPVVTETSVTNIICQNDSLHTSISLFHTCHFVWARQTILPMPRKCDSRSAESIGPKLNPFNIYPSVSIYPSSNMTLQCLYLAFVRCLIPSISTPLNVFVVCPIETNRKIKRLIQATAALPDRARMHAQNHSSFLPHTLGALQAFSHRHHYTQ